METQGQKHL